MELYKMYIEYNFKLISNTGVGTDLKRRGNDTDRNKNLPAASLPPHVTHKKSYTIHRGPYSHFKSKLNEKGDSWEFAG